MTPDEFESKIDKVLIMVQMKNGNIHQVLASAEKKELAVGLLRNEEGVLQLLKPVEPLNIRWYDAPGNI